MKMVCIKKGVWGDRHGEGERTPGPNYGEIVEVERVTTSNRGWEMYYLIGYEHLSKSGARVRYAARRFAPIKHDETKACDSAFLDQLKRITTNA